MILTKIDLIPFAREHVKQTFHWVHNLELRHLFLTRGEVTWQGHKKYSNKVLSDPSQRVYALFVDDQHVGNCGYKNLAHFKKKGEIWIYIGEPSMRGKGIGKHATERLIKEGFEHLGLEMIYLHVADFNEAARKMYKTLGFTEVPLKENAQVWENRACRIIRMELKKS